MAVKHVRTSALDIAYQESGPADGVAVRQLGISLSITESAGLKLSQGRISYELGKLVAIEVEYEEANGR